MSFWSIMSKNADAILSVYDVTNTFNSADGSTSKSRTLSGTIEGIIWDATASNLQLAEKLRDVVDKTVAVSPTASVTQDQEIDFNDISYSIVQVDNVANKGKVKILFLQEQS
jgi:hypothetical protein